MDKTNLPHVTQVTLVDEVLAFVTNSVQFAVIALRKHPEAATKELWLKSMSAAFAALDSFPMETLVETVNLFQNAAEGLEKDERFTSHEPSQQAEPSATNGGVWCDNCQEYHDKE